MGYPLLCNIKIMIIYRFFMHFSLSTERPETDVAAKKGGGVAYSGYAGTPDMKVPVLL